MSESPGFCRVAGQVTGSVSVGVTGNDGEGRLNDCLDRRRDSVMRRQAGNSFSWSGG